MKVNKILLDFDADSEPDTTITRKSYRCKQVKVKDISCFISCFKRTYCVSEHSYSYVKYILTCPECLDKSVKNQ